MVNIGVGYTLPFKVVGAPSAIDAETFSKALNETKISRSSFSSLSFQTFLWQVFALKNCSGVLIHVTDKSSLNQSPPNISLSECLKSLPKEFKEALDDTSKKREFFCKVNGTEEVYRIMQEKPHIVGPCALSIARRAKLFWPSGSAI